MSAGAPLANVAALRHPSTRLLPEIGNKKPLRSGTAIHHHGSGAEKLPPLDYVRIRAAETDSRLPHYARRRVVQNCLCKCVTR